MDVDVSPPLSLNSMVDVLHNSGECHKDEIIQLTLRLKEVSRLESKLKAIQICLGPALDVIELDDLESSIFCHILPFTNQLFSKTLQDIDLEIKNNSIGNIKNFLQVSLEILSCCENTLKHVAKFEPIKFELVSSLPVNIASILLSSFDHCRLSDSIYGDNLSNITEVLTALFHKTCDVQTNLLSFLTNGVKFHCLFDDELQSLLEVMHILEKCGEVLMTLGIKPLVQQWKGYAQLAATYRETIQTSLDVTKPIRFLANDLGQRLLKTLQIKENDAEGRKQSMKELKVGAFILKIIVKLCEQYSGYLGDCHNDLVALLARLHGISKPFLNVSETPNEEIDFIDRNITVGAGPLITTLLDDRAFIEAIKHMNSLDCLRTMVINEDKVHRIGQLLLSVAIMKKLITIDREILQMWLKSEILFVHIIFNLIEQGSVDFDLDMRLERTESPGNSDLYETILTHISAYLLISTTEQTFGQLEKFLESKIIQRKYWVALMASDIFLLLSRFGNSDLKLHQAKYFLSKTVSWPTEDKHSTEWIFLSNFTHRLIKLVPLESINGLLANYPPSVWAELDCGSVPGSTEVNKDRVFISLQKFLSSSDDIPQSKSFNNMIGELLSLPSIPDDADYEKYKSLLSAVAKLWQLCEYLLFSKEKELGYWFDRFLVDLTTSSCNLLILMDNHLINLILRSLNQELKRNCASSKLISIEFLKILAHIEMTSNNSLSEVFKNIAGLFSKLIEDEDPIISSNALECFEYFANVTVNTRVISMTGQQSSSTQHLITSYLQRNFMSHASSILQFPKSLECAKAVDVKYKCTVDRNLPSNSIKIKVPLSRNTSTEPNESLNKKLTLLKNRLNNIVEESLKNYEQDRANDISESDVKFILEKLENCIAECADRVNK